MNKKIRVNKKEIRKKNKMNNKFRKLRLNQEIKI